MSKQSERIAELEAQGVDRTYSESIQGAGIVRAFERYLETGDSAKISRGLYELATMRCGYIAHFDIHGFRQVFADPADFLRGELNGTDTWGLAYHGNGGRWHPNYDAAPNVYTDGMTDGEVYAACCAVASRLARDVLDRSVSAERDREIEAAKQLAAKHGFALQRA